MTAKNNKFSEKIHSIKEESGKFFSLFIFLFLTAMVAINWGTIKDMFNYNRIYSEISDSFRKELFSQKEEENLKVPDVKLSKKEFESSEKADSIEIPKIGIEAPFMLSQDASDSELEQLLQKGVVFYPESSLPGEGATVILGHSAPPNWPKINYDWVFTRLNELNAGDEIVVHFDHHKYTYKVTQKLFLNKGDDIPRNENSELTPTLTLLSCWPPGIDNKRIAVQAEIQQ